MSETPNLTLEDVQKLLAVLVWKKPELREEIVKNPRAVIEREIGITLNKDLNIQVVSHQSPNECTFILPFKPNHDALSDEDLESAAGGFLLSSGIKVLQTGAGYADSLIQKVVNPGAATDLGQSFGQSIRGLFGK